MKGLSWHPSGPFTPVDVLEASRVNARRLLRPPPLAASHHHGILTPPRVVAMAAHGRAAPPVGSTPDLSAQRPLLVSWAATFWLSPCRASAQGVATGAVSWCEASRNYNRSDIRPTAAVSRP